MPSGGLARPRFWKVSRGIDQTVELARLAGRRKIRDDVNGSPFPLRGADMVIKTLPPPLTEAERMERYGYREIPMKRPDGSTEYRRVALTLDDLLHPQMGDVAVLSNIHDLETTYLATVFRSCLAHDPRALVLRDCGVYWDVPPLRHHSPDVSVIFNVHEPKAFRAGFHVAAEGTRPTIIIEVVSPDYRQNDVETKVVHYHTARVPFYYIVDRESPDDPAGLIGYEWARQEYVPLSPNADGRFWLDSIGVWLGIEDGKVACFDGAAGKRLGDYTEISEALQKAELLAKAAEKCAKAAEKRAKAAEKRAAEVEAELNALKEKLRTPPGSD
jgi:colicin import membrane protein